MVCHNNLKGSKFIQMGTTRRIAIVATFLLQVAKSCFRGQDRKQKDGIKYESEKCTFRCEKSGC